MARIFYCAISFLILVAFVSADAAAIQTNGTRLLRDPDISKEKIAFVHANDIWTVDRDGGDAMRLTSGEGAETDPVFSPDGKKIAFTAQYGGNSDVYVVDADGSEPKRLTWHPGGDAVQGWTNDGKILFRSGRAGQPTKLWQFYTVSIDGGLPKKLAVPQAYHGEMSADGNWLAYQEIGLWDPEWRNYRGGQAQPIAIVSTKTWERTTTTWKGERHLAPVWLDGVVYYLSERDYAANVWSYDPKTKTEKQLTKHEDFDCKSIGAGDGVIIYEQAGYLHELNPKTGDSKQIKIRIARDLNWARPRWEDVSAMSLRDARLSPTGKRAIFEARGDLFTAPLDKGSWRNITQTSGVADRHAVWSPDGQKIAWFNDEGGEYGMIIADQHGKNKRRIKIPNPTFYFVPTWSPDGKQIAFSDTDYRVLVLNVESGEIKHVDTDRYAHPERSMNPVWSPDSRWLAYPRRLETQLRVIALYDTKNGTKHDLTNGMADSISPVWDASGKYIYFLGSTDFALNIGWLDMTSYDRPVTRSLYVAILKSDLPSPFLPESDEEKPEEKKKDGDKKAEDNTKEGQPADKKDDSAADAKKDVKDDKKTGDGKSGDEKATDKKSADKKSADKKKKEVKVEIDFEKIAFRIVDAPGLAPRNYVDLAAGPAGKVFVLEEIQNQPGTTVHQYTLKDKKAVKFADKIRSITTSHDRKKVLLQTATAWKSADAASPPKDGGKALKLSGMRVKVDPRAEWRQMLREGWRFMRDFLYVDNVHGAKWDEVWEWYSPWLDHVNHRSDFNYLLDIVSGEVAVGHSYVRGGDLPDLTSPRTGLLGADLEAANGRYRIAKIYSGEEWTPGLAGPLSMPGLKVKVGDYLMAIDGTELKDDINPFQVLEGTAGRTITISVNSEPKMEGAKNIMIVPTASENQLRTWDWVAENQRRVDKLSDGKLAYVWLPNTGRGGYSYFNRMYFAQQNREGAVIDERNNGGGSAADYIVDILDRELTGYFNSNSGDKKPFTQPMAGLFGPKAMIINERAGSGGDLLPYLFRFKKIGPLIGTKTWGGLVGTWDTPPLIDGGRFVAPRGGFIDVDGKWAVEGEGVAPDIEIRNDPKPVIAGKDPQLERAIAEVLELLKTKRVEFKPEPSPPVRALRPADKR